MVQDNWQLKSILHFFEIKINVFYKNYLISLNKNEQDF